PDRHERRPLSRRWSSCGRPPAGGLRRERRRSCGGEGSAEQPGSLPLKWSEEVPPEPYPYVPCQTYVLLLGPRNHFQPVSGLPATIKPNRTFARDRCAPGGRLCRSDSRCAALPKGLPITL